MTAATRGLRLATLLLGALLLGARPAVAQDLPEEPARQPAPFSEISVRGLASRSLSARGIPEWTDAGAAQAGVQMPFHTGILEAGLHGRLWRTDDTQLPDWMAVFVFAGWQARGSMNGRADLSGGLRMGNYVMQFDTDAVAGQRRESEFAVAPVVGLRVRLSDRLHVHAEAMWVRVLTRPVLDVREWAAGLSYTLDTPGWLEGILR